jgi:hypothetical protein
MALVSAPTLTATVVQNFFIEALGGSQDPISYLDRFPDTVYTKAYDSLLVQLAYALLGPAGVGLLRQEYLEARLQVEAAGLQTTDLDALYTNAFAFARLAEETYELDASADLLPASERAQVLAQDAAFRNRAQDFLRGARAGGTVLGVTLAAQSGLGQPVEAFENFRTLFDHYTDIPLELPVVGQTNRVNEVTIIPRQLVPQNDVQEILLSGEPTQGWFTLTYPAGQNWLAIPVQCVSGQATITVPDTANFPPGTFVTITDILSSVTNPPLDPTVVGWNNAQLYAEVGAINGSSTVSLVYPLSAGADAGDLAPVPSTGTFYAFVGNAQTTALPYNATAAEVGIALVSLPVIGLGNVICTGGPLPDQAITVTFSGALSDVNTPTIAANIATDLATGVGTLSMPLLADNTGSPLNVDAVVSTLTPGVSPTQDTSIAPADEYAMRLAIDQIKPLTTFITTQPGTTTTFQQEANTTFSGTNQIEVVRYVTGRSDVPWPGVDNTHWIQAGLEHEAPLPFGTNGTQYTGFHNISSITAYTEGALSDAGYILGTTPISSYWDTLIGNFSQAQLVIMPGLNALQNVQMQFTASGAQAAQPDPLVITNVGGRGVINGSYPVDYMSLPGVTQPASGTLWASMERVSGEDYLEIDLGQAQPVNFLYFEATAKPYSIDIAYDVLDQSPQRLFASAIVPPHSQSSTSLVFSATKIWNDLSIFITNQLGGMIYTRFLRIGFNKLPAGTPFAPIGQPTIPFSIEVRNLRIGRNVV